MTKKHQELAERLCKTDRQLYQELDVSNELHYMHMAMGIATECGELIDALKKATIYKQELDRENIIEELGDLLFYLSGLTSRLDITLEEVVDANCKKLNKRYPIGFTTHHAKARLDKSYNAQD